MDDDLFRAILAMDSYNRGYNQGIDGLASSGSIGDATILRESDVADDSAGVSIGFYGIAYEYYDEVIISYRGTDQAIDALYGWIAGGGVYDAPQAEMAFSFYEAVDAATVYDISLTGHSLGKNP